MDDSNLKSFYYILKNHEIFL